MSVKTIMFEIEGLIKNTVMSCAAMYGFSVEEALAKIDSNGNLIRAVVDKELKKEEKQRAKNAEKVKKEAEKQQKAELASMKEADVLSKAAEKLALKQQKVKKVKNVKKVAVIEATPVIKSASEDEEPFIRFKNVPLMNEINSIRDVKKFKNYKKLSAGVKLARQLMDI